MRERRKSVSGAGRLQVAGETLEAPAADWIPPFLLLALREDGRHEVDLVLKLVFLGFDASRTGRIRQALREMEAEGLVVASEGPAGAPFGKGFEITHLGEAYLEAWANSLASYRGEIDSLLGLYDNEPSVPVACGGCAPH